MNVRGALLFYQTSEFFGLEIYKKKCVKFYYKKKKKFNHLIHFLA